MAKSQYQTVLCRFALGITHLNARNGADLPPHQETPVTDSHPARPGHAVADPALGHDVSRCIRIITELVPQFLDEGPHQFRLAVFAPAPDLAQQRFVGHYPTCVE